MILPFLNLLDFIKVNEARELGQLKPIINLKLLKDFVRKDLEHFYHFEENLDNFINLLNNIALLENDKPLSRDIYYFYQEVFFNLGISELENILDSIKDLSGLLLPKNQSKRLDYSINLLKSIYTETLLSQKNSCLNLSGSP